MLPKIADFGLGRFVTDCTAMQQLTGNLGTPMWMAPELIEDRGYGPPVDVYAFGIILWEMYTEKIPFDGLDRLTVFRNVSQGSRPDLPEETSPLSVLIQQCWDQDPNKRPSFEEIYSQFENREVEFPGTEQRSVDVLIHEIQQREEVINQAIEVAAKNLNEIAALRKAPKTREQVQTLLVKAAKEGEINMLTKLIGAYLEQGDLNGKDAGGVAPIFAAIQAGQLLVVQYLFKMPTVNKNLRDAEDNTPLIAAVKYGQVRLAGFICQQKGVEVNLQNKFGMTALHVLAMMQGNLQASMGRALGGCKAFKFDVLDQKGKQPFADHPDLMGYFQDKGKEKRH
jgi:hypothetical protein